MYKQIEKPKDNKSRMAVNSITQKRSNWKQDFLFENNRSAAEQHKVLRLGLAEKTGHTGNVFQLLQQGCNIPCNSEADGEKSITKNNSVITASQEGNQLMGHTRIFIESRNTKNKGYNFYTHLTLTGRQNESCGTKSTPARQQNPTNVATSGVTSGSSGMQCNTATPNITYGYPATLAEKGLGRSVNSRSWVVDRANALEAINTAKNEASNVGGYKFKFIGNSLFGGEQALNCARYGENILVAAGINASAGAFIKTPFELATGRKF